MWKHFPISLLRPFSPTIRVAPNSPEQSWPSLRPADTFANANDSAKKQPTEKRADKLKKSQKKYYGKIVLQTPQTYYFKRLLSYPKSFGKFFRISNVIKQQRFSHKLTASAKIFKWTSLANIISYPIKLFSSFTLFIKVIKIVHKHDRL